MAHILVVDDDRDLCALVARSVEAEGLAADCCFSGREALDRLVQGFSAKQPERALEYVRLADSLLPDRRFALFRASLNAFWLWKQMSCLLYTSPSPRDRG